LHRAWRKEAVAFVVAHEMAHYDLGHTRLLGEQTGWARALAGLAGAMLYVRSAARLLNGPDNEAAADALALDLCRKAGYEARACLEAFDVLAAYALDHGDIEIVYGPEPPANPAAQDGLACWIAAGQEWLWKRRRGYASLEERKAALAARLDAAQVTPSRRAA
jgi:hypothetical protein